jgi:hypothetical protein
MIIWFESRPKHDPGKRPGMESSLLNRSGQPIDKAAANRLAAKIAAERQKRIQEQGHA